MTCASEYSSAADTLSGDIYLSAVKGRVKYMDRHGSCQGSPLISMLGDSRQVLYRVTSPVFDVGQPVLPLVTAGVNLLSGYLEY